MARKEDVYVANETFICELDGAQTVVHKGQTRVRAGHPLVETYPGYFDAEEGPHFDVEAATAAPGEKRGSKAASSE
jgi:hypothetical protein